MKTKKIILTVLMSIFITSLYSQYIDTSGASINGDIYHTGTSLNIGDTADGDAKQHDQYHRPPCR
jgi:hypothetical protein